jgi:CcmD family protein
MNHLGYLGAAYAVIFVLIALYVIVIGRRQARLEREVRRLESVFKKQPASTEDGDAEGVSSRI